MPLGRPSSRALDERVGHRHDHALDDVEAEREALAPLASQRKIAPLFAPVRSSARSMMRRSSASTGVAWSSTSVSVSFMEMLQKSYKC